MHTNYTHTLTHTQSQEITIYYELTSTDLVVIYALNVRSDLMRVC